MRKYFVFLIVLFVIFTFTTARAKVLPDYLADLPVTGGKYIFVGSAMPMSSNSNPSDASSHSYEFPLQTIDAAINACTAKSTTSGSEYPGDVIVILPGHAETVDATDDIVPDTEGIYFYGCGEGDGKPTITINGSAFDSENAITITGADCTFENIIFTSTYADANYTTQAMLDLGADDLTFKRCVFKIADDATEDIIYVDTDNDADNLRLIDCEFYGYSGGADSAVYADDTQTGWKIINCSFYGDYDVAPLYADEAMTNAEIRDCRIENDAGDQYAIEWTNTGNTGYFTNNILYTDDLATAYDCDDMWMSGNKFSMGAELAAIDIPVKGSRINAGIIDVYVQSGSDTTIVDETLCGYPNDYFNYGWTVKFTDSDGTGINVDVTDFVSATGTLTVDSMSETPAAGDRVILSFNPLMSDVVSATDLTNEVPDGSVLSYILDDAGDTSSYDDAKHSLYAIGTDTDSLITSVAALSLASGLPYIMATQDSATDTTSIIDVTYALYGNDFFNTGWVATCLLNADSVGNAPEGQTRDITDYDSTTGDFTTAAFSAAIGTGDKFFIYYDPLKATAASTDLTNYYPDGSAMSWILDDGGDTSGFVGTQSSLTAIGIDADAILADTISISGAALPTVCTANSLAAFIASGGTGLGTELADSKSIVNAIGSTGAALIDDAAGVAGQIGVNDADNAMDTSTVVANQDGSVFERLEQMQRMMPQVAETTSVSIGTTTADIFTVTGGYVEILGLYAFLTTATDATATNMTLTWDPAQGTDLNLATATSVASKTQYSYLYLTGDVSDAIAYAATGTDLPKTFQESTNGETMIVGPGTIDMTLSADPSGAATFYLYYRIIEIGAAVTAYAL